ncbi:ferric reductase-like transmembrane domain-containing protein [Ancylomarina sp. DW003]|nr:ferric reductase-like transmembrane domain-containing protein [Ancylomarina sp. DW003]MDE5424153.1 ferric reductase-like transmembrane domain-containing protein [Ancylomarina sp. DW003]
MKILKQEWYFPLIIGIHFIFWTIDLYFYKGSFIEVSSDTLLFGEMTNESWFNFSRIFGEVLSSWVVTVFAANFLMATRAKWIEKIFGGLDKMYLIHRRAAIIATVLIIAHFIFVPRDLTAFNPGKPLGFYAFALIMIGVIVSAAPPLKKKIPYHKWLNFHKLMGVFYVMAVIHGLMVNSLIKELPITRIYVFGMSFIGVGAWFYKAFLFGLFNKKLTYKVASSKIIGNSVTELILEPEGKALNFEAGQFAFFTFPKLSKKEQHPFTISSHPLDDKLRLTTKNLGDYTKRMDTLTENDIAYVEGSYGLFSSKYAKEKDQVWIAGGIGITPFLSLAKDIYTHKVQLIWCVNSESEAIYSAELNKIAENNPNFNFSVWVSNEKGHLTVDKLKLEDYSSKAYFICGPELLKKNISNQLTTNGVKMTDIYDEEFAFR